MIDSHCHLADEVFAADLEAVVARAREAGVTSALVHPRCRATREARAGPSGARAVAERRASPSASIRIRRAATRASRARPSGRSQGARAPTRVRALGEMGLDYHYDFAPRDVQQAVFAAQVALCARDATCRSSSTRAKPTPTPSRILARRQARGVRGVFHCFTGDDALARGARSISASTSRFQAS